MTKTIPWTTGSGNIILTYNGGQGNDSVVVTTDTDNTGIDRQQTLTFKTTNNAVTKTVSVKQYGMASRYLTFVALESGTFTFTGRTPSGKTTNSLSYSLDGGSTWTALASGSASPTVAAGGKILWKGNCNASSASGSEGIGVFSSDGTFNIEGNILSLRNGDNFQGIDTINSRFCARLFSYSKVVSAKNLILPTVTNLYCYYYMFSDCLSLVTPPVLPSTLTAEYCYKRMFSGCSALTTAPSLPSTVLYTQCYYAMFYGCTSLTTAPVLPGAKPGNSSYYYMFYGCSGINHITCLATDISASNCVYRWVSGVAANGTFVKAASMTSWTSGSNGIPNGWIVQDA